MLALVGLLFSGGLSTAVYVDPPPAEAIFMGTLQIQQNGNKSGLCGTGAPRESNCNDGEPCQNIGNKATHALCALGCRQILRPVNQHVSFTRIEVLISLVQRLWHGASTRQCCLPVNSIHTVPRFKITPHCATQPSDFHRFPPLSGFPCSVSTAMAAVRVRRPNRSAVLAGAGVFSVHLICFIAAHRVSNPPPHHCERTPHHTAFLALQCAFRRGHRACVTQL